jgi:DNA-binding response OmpR family regulator
MSAATLASVLDIQVSLRVRLGGPARPDRHPGRGPARYHPRVMGMPARILLAEDQASVAAPVVSRLIAAGHEVKWVREMRELRQQMDDNPPDLLLLDTTLDVDGLEYFQAVRFSPDHPRAGVVILTPPGDVRTKERAQQLGAAAVLAKPLDEDALVAVVGDLLSMI